MIKKFEKMKTMQSELGNLGTELNERRVEVHNLNLQLSLVKQDSSNDTPTEPIIEKLQETRQEILNMEKRIEALNGEIATLSEKLISYASAETESELDKAYEALRILDADYDKAWRSYQADETSTQKQATVKALRQQRTELQDKLMAGERMLRQLKAGSLLSLNRFFQTQSEAVVA